MEKYKICVIQFLFPPFSCFASLHVALCLLGSSVTRWFYEKMLQRKIEGCHAMCACQPLDRYSSHDHFSGRFLTVCTANDISYGPCWLTFRHSNTMAHQKSKLHASSQQPARNGLERYGVFLPPNFRSQTRTAKCTKSRCHRIS